MDHSLNGVSPLSNTRTIISTKNMIGATAIHTAEWSTYATTGHNQEADQRDPLPCATRKKSHCTERYSSGNVSLALLLVQEPLPGPSAATLEMWEN
jgi:hypothetical protein